MPCSTQSNRYYSIWLTPEPEDQALLYCTLMGTAAQHTMECLDFIQTLHYDLFSSCAFDVNVMSSPYIDISRDHLIKVKLIYRDVLYEGAFRLGLDLIHLFQLQELLITTLRGRIRDRQMERTCTAFTLHLCHPIYLSLLLGLFLFLVSYRCVFWEPRSVPQVLWTSAVVSNFSTSPLLWLSYTGPFDTGTASVAAAI